MSWPLVCFDEIIADSAFGPRFSSDCYDDAGNVATLRTTDISPDGVITLDTMPIAKIDEDKFANHFLKIGDLVISRSGRIGTTAIFNGYHKPVLPGAFLIRFRLELEKACPLFFRLFFNSNEGQQRLMSVAQGAAQQNINITNVKKLLVPLPPISKQLRIASVLLNYDNLIATNQRRIQLLEEAARRLYREWFVNLRFPGYESVVIKKGIPEGWQSLPLTTVADFINGFAFKPGHQMDYGLPIIKIPELRDGVSDKTPRNAGTEIPDRNRIDTGDVLFSWSATLLVNEWNEGTALLNQHLFKVVPKNAINKRLIRFAVENAIPSLLGQSVGATMQHIRRSALDGHHILMPDEKIGIEFASVVDLLIDQVLVLHAQNKHLVRARDMLLPKLMSGQLDVSAITLPDEVAA